MEPYWDLIKQIVRESDIVLEILDARAVDLSMNEQLERIISKEGRPRILVVNKADLVEKRELEENMDNLAALRKTDKDYIVYFSNKWKSKTVKMLLARIRQVFAKHGKREGFDESKPLIKKPYREAKGDIIVGVLGYPNVGKSSVINSLSFKKKAKVSSKAGTTHGVHWISAGDGIKLVDTPGVIPIGSYVDESKLGIIAAKSTEKLKDPETVAGRIIEMFLKEGKMKRFEEFYNFKINPENEENPYVILEQLALAKRHLKKGGVADEIRTAIVVVKDWQSGRLRL